MSAAAAILLLCGCGESEYPVVQSIAQSAWTDNAATSHPVTMPTGCNAGDLKIVLFDNDLSGSDTAVTTPAGWTELFSTTQGTNNRFGVYVRIHAGGDPATVDFVTSVGQQAAAQALRVTGWTGAISGGVEAAPPQTSIGATPNPSSFSPTFGAGNNLWIAVLGDSSITPVTAAPPGYSNLTSTVSTQTVAGAQVFSAQKTSTSATEDPGAWTSASGGNRVYSTIAIAPAA